MEKNELESIGSKPSGWLGNLAGRLMNRIHSSAYKNLINKYIAESSFSSNNSTVLDIGCGGGIALKLFSQLNGVNKVTGIDYSDDMVKLSQKINRRKIENGVVEVKKADVSSLPFENNSFDIITAFDTINFWPDHNRAITEILRILKQEGVFYIINAYPKAGTRWHDFVQFKNDKEYRDYLSSNGLKSVESAFEKNSIIVWGRK